MKGERKSVPLFPWLIAVAAASLFLGFVINIFAKDLFETVSCGSDSYSRSAVGHGALVELLRHYGKRVEISERVSPERIDATCTVLSIEPFFHKHELGAVEIDRRLNDFQQLHNSAQIMFVVLPKWNWIPNPLAPRTIAGATPCDVEDAMEVLTALEVPGSVTRRADKGVVPESDWRVRSLSYSPSLELPQLMQTDELIPIISSRDGILLGYRKYDDRSALYLLSDPDLLANHGIGDGDNARLLSEFFDKYLTPNDQTVIIDETMHGYLKELHVWRELFRFPVAFITWQCLLAGLLIAWAGSGRFGAPAAAPLQLDAGKGFLIANTASLLRFTRRTGYSLSRYFQMTVRELAEELRIPAAVHVQDWPRWLEEFGEKRHIATDVRALESAARAHEQKKGAPEPALLETARAISQWKEDLRNAVTRDPTR